MFIGIDLGGTKILTAVADTRGRVLASVKLDTQAKQGPEAVLKNIRRSVTTALEKSGCSMAEISCIGVGAPGPIIGDGVIIAPPNLPGFGRYALKKKLSAIFGKKIVVENDANAAAVAEHTFGSGKGTRDFVYITVSTGIGGGIILDRKLYKGSLGTAGEIGHMVIDLNGPRCGCGSHGCLEAMASGPAIAKAAGKKTAIEVFELAKKGDKKCLEAIRNAGKYIGIGMANIINILDPEVIAIGGGVSNMGAMIFDPIRQWGKNNTLSAARGSAKIVKAKLKNDVGVLGAIAICMEACPPKPERRRRVMIRL